MDLQLLSDCSGKHAWIFECYTSEGRLNISVAGADFKGGYYNNNANHVWYGGINTTLYFTLLLPIKTSLIFILILPAHLKTKTVTFTCVLDVEARKFTARSNEYTLDYSNIRGKLINPGVYLLLMHFV